MKNFYKVLIGLILIASVFLSACAPPPPPVTQDQLDTTDAEALKVEKEASQLKVEMNDLEEEVAVKKAELKSLKDYQKQLETEE